MTFEEIYLTVDEKLNPKSRTLKELGVILNHANEISNHPHFNILDDDSYLRIKQSKNNTVIARLLHEIDTIKLSDNRIFISKSESIESAILQVNNCKSLVNKPEISSFLSANIFGILDATKDFIIYLIQGSLIDTKKIVIKENLLNCNSKIKKLNFLNFELLSIKQNLDSRDKYQSEKLIEYLELEIEKWKLFKEEKTNEIEFKSCNDLYEFVLKIINTRLKHNITYEEGYRVFWRNQKCNVSPKNETEVQHYIEAILTQYCESNNVKISREEFCANGKIDFCFTYLNFTVCLEVKKAHHVDVCSSVKTQLTEYMKGKQTGYGIYVILWYNNKVGFKKPNKFSSLQDLESQVEIPDNGFNYTVVGIDCTKPNSPSMINKNKR